MSTDLSKLLETLKKSNDAYNEASSLFGAVPETNPEEPSLWEKLFQPFNDKVRAWNARMVSPVSDVVTGEQEGYIPGRKPKTGLVDISTIPEGQRGAQQFDEQGNPIDEQGNIITPAPESWLQSLMRKEQAAFGALGQDILQKPGIKQASEAFTTPFTVPNPKLPIKIPPGYGVPESPETLTTSGADILGKVGEAAFAVPPLISLRNVGAGLKSLAKNAEVVARELPAGEAGRLGAPAEIRKTLPKLVETKVLQATQEAGAKAGLDVEAVQGISPNEYWVAITHKAGKDAAQSRFDWLQKVLPTLDEKVQKTITDLIPLQSRNKPTQSFIPFKTVEDAQKFIESGDVSGIVKTLELKGQPMKAGEIKQATKALSQTSAREKKLAELAQEITTKTSEATKFS